MNFNYDIAKTVATSGREKNPAIAQVVALVQGAPFALSIPQIMAVAKDAGLELPTETTVRVWLQGAAKDGDLTRPTIRTYAGMIQAAVEEVSEQPVEEVEPAVEDFDDPLAGL